MTDLEQRLRNALEDEGRAAPAPHDARPTLRRVRRRQALTVLTSAACVVALVAVGFLGFAAVSDDDGGTPAATTTTGTLNGISITYPENWALIDPDAAGLNGASGADDLPRLVLFLSPAPADDTLACPTMEGAVPRWFVISVQEEPLALAGDAASPWPVRPTLTRTLPDSSCYPGWDFLETRWTAAGRTFDGRIGIAPDAGAGDRAAVLDAFSSMTFEAAAQTATSAVVAEGTIDGEHWEVIASTSESGLELTLQSETFGTGGIAGDPTSGRLHLMDHVFGEGPEAKRLVFAAVSARVAHVNVTDQDSDDNYEVIDVPDEIHPDQNAFVISLPPEMSAVVSAFDPGERLIASGRIRGSDGIPVVPEEADPLPDGLHFGFVRAVDPASLTIGFDVATWLSGDEADAAWQAAGNTGSVPNDYFVENDDPALATMPLASDAQVRLLDWNACCDTFFDGDLGAWAEAIETQGDVERGGRLYRGVSSWWVTVEDGVVIHVEEQYTP